MLYRELIFYTICLFISHLPWPVTPEHCLMDKYPVSVPSEINGTPLTVSQILMQVSGCVGNVQSLIAGKCCQMGADAAPRGWGACQGTSPSKSLLSALSHISSAGPGLWPTPSCSALSISLFYSVSSSSTVLFIFQSDHLHCTQPAPSHASECIYYDSQKLDSI